MRGIALAQAWQDAGGTVTLASAEMPEALAGRLKNEGIQARTLSAEVASAADAAATLAIAHDVSADWIVVDGYRFTSDYLAALRAGGSRVLVVDDMAQLARYPADLILNQNLSTTRELYRGKHDGDAELLLGPRYALLRREFRFTRVDRATAESRRSRVLISFGGADTENFTLAVLQRLAERRARFEVVVLAGAANPHIADLQAFAVRAPFPCAVRVNIPNVAAEMARADAAISAGGSTVWELAAMRLPALIGAISVDQRLIGPALRRVGGFRAWTIEKLLEQDLVAEIDALLRGPRDFGGLDAAGALRVVEQLTHPLSLCESTP